jgi:hypothetical protein
MEPMFTIHAGEFLVGDYINRNLSRKHDVWIPSKDTGIDLLVTCKKRCRKSVGLQVKLSRAYGIREAISGHLLATSWYTLKPAKIRKSTADLWVFVILTIKQTPYFVLVPTRELRKRIPKNCGPVWHLYLWVLRDQSCYQVRDLSSKEQLLTVVSGVRDVRLDYSRYLNNWPLLEKLSH